MSSGPDKALDIIVEGYLQLSTACFYNLNFDLKG